MDVSCASRDMSTASLCKFVLRESSHIYVYGYINPRRDKHVSGCGARRRC